MQNRTWKLGEPCFIVDMSIGMTHANMRIMPGIITHLADSFAQGTSFSTRMAGKQFVEGMPFASEKEAREWIGAYVRRIAAAAEDAGVEGMQPGWQIPKTPRTGDIVYGIDAEAKEVFEAHVGLVRLELGRLEVGYDNSQDNVRIREWWPTKDEALAEAHKRFGGIFIFVPKEEVVHRARTAEQKIWDNAATYMRSPEFRSGMRQPAESLRESK